MFQKYNEMTRLFFNAVGEKTVNSIRTDEDHRSILVASIS